MDIDLENNKEKLKKRSTSGTTGLFIFLIFLFIVLVFIMQRIYKSNQRRSGDDYRLFTPIWEYNSDLSTRFWDVFTKGYI